MVIPEASGSQCRFVLASTTCPATASRLHMGGPQLLASVSLQPSNDGAHDASIRSWVQSFPRLPFNTAQPDEVASTSGSHHDSSSTQPTRRFPPVLLSTLSQGPVEQKNLLRTAPSDATRDTSDALCIETFQDRMRVYRIQRGTDNGRAYEGFDMLEDSQTNEGRMINMFKSYILPQGFPDSVAPQYAPYMFWRGVQYFFGGAMSVFTTKSLLGALGVAGKMGGEAAAAINWVVKDGAGRFGRFLFARWGRELDCELKQFRLMGDLLMQGGASLELATALAPQAFLPLACTANLAKNLAAVAASSTRAPIYKTFALSNNLADVTAKGESVANLADVLGTIFGILVSKARAPVLPTFCFLSAGYLISSRREVDAVELPYLNRARLAYTVARYLQTGSVPGIAEANHSEPLLPFGNRYNQGRIVLGARVEQACSSPAALQQAAKQYRGEKFMMTFRPDTKKVYIVLRKEASTKDFLKAAFAAHTYLWLLDDLTAGQADNRLPGVLLGLKLPLLQDTAKPLLVDNASSNGTSNSSASSKTASQRGANNSSSNNMSGEAWQQAMDMALARTDAMYADFTRQAERHGWQLQATMLNPKETRLVKLGHLA